MLKLYTLSNCIHCNELKSLLKNDKIEFQEIDVDLPENEKNFLKIHRLTKSDDVPIIIVNKMVLVPNISFKTINEAIELIKKNL